MSREHLPNMEGSLRSWDSFFLFLGAATLRWVPNVPKIPCALWRDVTFRHFEYETPAPLERSRPFHRSSWGGRDVRLRSSLLRRPPQGSGGRDRRECRGHAGWPLPSSSLRLPPRLRPSLPALPSARVTRPLACRWGVQSATIFSRACRSFFSDLNRRSTASKRGSLLREGLMSSLALNGAMRARGS